MRCRLFHTIPVYCLFHFVSLCSVFGTNTDIDNDNDDHDDDDDDGDGGGGGDDGGALI